jgi:hypothetical protein
MIQEDEVHILTSWVKEGYINDSTINSYLPHVKQWYWELKDEDKTNSRNSKPCS